MMNKISKDYKIGFHQMYFKIKIHFQLVVKRNFLVVIKDLVPKLKLKEISIFQNILDSEFNSNSGRSIHGMMKNSKSLLMEKLYLKDHLDSVLQDKPKFVELLKVLG